MANGSRIGEVGLLSSAISSALVSLRKQRTGKGSPRARTYISDNLIVCVQRDGMTAAELSIRDDGRSSEVEQWRQTIDEALAKESVPIVEKLTEQRVITALSKHDVERDISVQCFLLEDDVSEDLLSAVEGEPR